MDPVVIMASPPCKQYSTMDVWGLSKAEDLIALTREFLSSTGRLTAIENVKGAAKEMADHAVLVYGSDFGLHVDRPRFFEANFPLIVDRYLREGGSALRSKACLGCRRRIRRLDPFGRPELANCCAGNLFPVQGKAPVGVSHAESACAMGIDPDHMPYASLAQAIPPAYAEFVFAQACMAACARDFGVPAISFDAMLNDPRGSSRTLRFWLRGAGDDSPSAGLLPTPATRR